MSQGASYRGRRRGILWEIVLAIFFGGAIFILLVLLTGGVLAYLIPIVVAMVLFGVVHYLFWGRSSMPRMARERGEAQTRAGVQAAPADQFDLFLNDKERAELIIVLEQALDLRREPERAPQKETLTEILDRLRGFGA